MITFDDNFKIKIIDNDHNIKIKIIDDVYMRAPGTPLSWTSSSTLGLAGV